MELDQPIVLDLLDTAGTPGLSSTSDMPIVETKPDAQNEGAPPAATADDAETTKAESATAPENEQPSASDEPKKAKGVQKRLDELTRQREDERRRAEAAEARLDRALAALEVRGGRPAEEHKADIDAGEPEPQRPNKHETPDPDAYEQAIMDYAEAKASWIARREVKAATVEASNRTQAIAVEQAQEAARSAYAARVETVKAKHHDFVEFAESPDVQVSIPMAAAILHSENGPELQYYLGRNPQEAERIRALSPPIQLLELGKIEARITASPAPAASKPAVSAAPAPIKPISGAAPSSQKSPEDMTMDEYAAYRRAQTRSDRSVRH